jgi:putative membrane protein
MLNKMMAGIGAIVLVSSLTLASAADNASQKFIKEAIEGNLSEIAVGKLAEQKAKSDDVRSFGEMLVKDHSDANQKATSVAGSLGVTPPAEPNRKQKAIYDKLAKLSGDKFDRAFVKAMVDDHKADIREFEKESKQPNDPAVAFANESLPILKKHLSTAQSLSRGKSASH